MSKMCHIVYFEFILGGCKYKKYGNSPRNTVYDPFIYCLGGWNNNNFFFRNVKYSKMNFSNRLDLYFVQPAQCNWRDMFERKLYNKAVNLYSINIKDIHFRWATRISNSLWIWIWISHTCILLFRNCIPLLITIDC